MDPAPPTSPEPRPAATVIIARPVAGGFEVLLVKRHGKSGFMAGAHVFPGGRVDDADAGPDRFVSAAVRETMEEARVSLAASALTPWSWWITPREEPKRFDTRFFLAEVPADTVAVVDEHEAVAFAWLTPRAALSAYSAGEIVLAPPTLATLEDLAPFASLADARAAVTLPLRAVCPRIVSGVGSGAGSGDDGLVLALPGDPLHDERERVFPHRTRIVMNAAGRFESRSVDVHASGTQARGGGEG
jgi:8-oxo-dGTP pyrophosphatase MutT (NUDIX family)